MATDVKKLIGEMTLEEKASLLGGDDFWHTKAVERLGIPRFMVSDGPHGLRKQDEKADHLGINTSIKAVCFPAGSATASSFDRGLVEKLGETIGDECQAENLSVVLGPAVCIKIRRAGRAIRLMDFRVETMEILTIFHRPDSRDDCQNRGYALQ